MEKYNPNHFTILLLVALAISVAVHPTRAAEIVFGQSSIASGSLSEQSMYFIDGIRASFHEANMAGGVNGNTLKLITLDDNYVPAQTTNNTRFLIENLNVFGLIGMYGSATAVAALNVATPYKIPLLGPMTGTAAIRKSFTPYAINLRAGYDDEALVMVRLLVGEMQLRRITLIYQDDSFGEPAMRAIVEVMTALRLSLASLHSYDNTKLSQLNYTRFAQNVSSHDPQGIILYATPTFARTFIPLFQDMHPGRRIPIVSGSFNGDAYIVLMKGQNRDPTHLYLTQVFPHPMANLNVSKRYRAAVTALGGPRATMFDHLGLEGYLVGRLAIEALRRTPVLTREEFLKTIYTTKLFAFEELLAGPFSDDCVHDPHTAKGRSSLCYCNQGMRFVGTMQINANYEYVQAAADMIYPMAECYATPDLVYRPLLLAIVAPKTAPNAALLQAAGSRLSAGMTLDQDIHAVTRTLQIENSSTARAITDLGKDALLLGAIGAMPLAPQAVYPEFPVLGTVPLADRGFVRTTVHLLATAQQQLHAIAELISLNATVSDVVLVLDADADALRNDAGESLREATRRSLVSFGRELAETRVFTAAATLQATLDELAGRRAEVVLAGLTDVARMRTVLDFLADASRGGRVRAFVLFHELAAVYADVEALYGADVLARVHFATNLPLWTATNELAMRYAQLTRAQAGAAAALRDPLRFVGYFMARMVQFVTVRTNGDASPEAFLSELYRTSLIGMGGVVLGPFKNECDGATAIEQATCGCNIGARLVSTYSMASISNGSDALSETKFDSCHVSYIVPVEARRSNTAAIAAGVVVPCVVLIALGVAAYMYVQHRKVADAPKDVAKFHSMFVALKRETLLWERRGDMMPDVMKHYQRIVREVARKHRCYVVKNIGGATLVVAVTSKQILGCAAELSKLLQERDWGLQHLPEAPFPGVTRHRNGTIASGVSDSDSNTHSTVRSAANGATNDGRSYHARSEDTASNCSRSTAASSNRKDKLSVEFAIGIHYDRGHIKREDDRHAYDYAGPAVDGAAVASDRAHGDQILITNSVARPESGFDESAFAEFCTSEWGKDTVLHQFNPPGMPVRFFNADEERDETNIDSIAAMLEQQSAGVTNKKVTVASVYLHNLESRSKAMPREAFARLYAEKLVAIQQIANQEKGHVHSFIGPRVTLSFNAVSPTPQATLRAFTAVEKIRELEAADNDGHVTAGIAADFAIVGSFKSGGFSHDAIVSRVAESAALLQRLCAQYNACHCLAQGAMFDELACFAVVEVVDVVRLPDAAKPRTLVSVHAFKNHGEGDREWMYGLADSSVDRFFLINAAFERIMSSPDVPEGIERVLGEVAEEFRSQSGYVNLRAMLQFMRNAGRDLDFNDAAIAKKDIGIDEYLASKKYIC